MTAGEIVDFLLAHGLVAHGVQVQVTPLTGGVSSDIALVEWPGRKICVKRALATLKVQRHWTADVRRSNHEVDWLRVARDIVPESVPEVLAADRTRNLFAMPYLAPEHYAVWKRQLLDGYVASTTAAQVGHLLGRIHAATANNVGLARQFAHDVDFAALRLDPYLGATAAAHPQLAHCLQALRQSLMLHKCSLVHGDVSPKNILVGAAGPVLLDAECAWYGDPSFDAAFCLNHLLLKCLVVPRRTSDFLRAANELVTAYLTHANWESRGELEQRIVGLLPALMLARVDGLSPVEYLPSAAQKNIVRNFATQQLLNPMPDFKAFSQSWSAAQPKDEVP